MGVFDRITIDDPRIPCGPGYVFQAYVNLWTPDGHEDSYGDFYRVDANGQLWRLTRSAGFDPEYGVLAPPERLDYTDPNLDVYRDDDMSADAYTLTFVHGKLVDWRICGHC